MAGEDDNTELLDRGDNLPEEPNLEDETATPPVETKPEGEDPPAVTDKLDDELEETDEERQAREAEEAEEARKKRIRVPKARLDEALEKARRREDELNTKIQQLQKQIDGNKDADQLADLETKIDELEDKRDSLLMDGKLDEAKAVRKQINALNKQLIEQTTSAKSDAARKAAVEDLRYDAALAHIESTYPALNPDSDDYDQDKINEVTVLLSAFQGRGMNRDVALQKAVKYVMGDPPKKDESSALRAARSVDARTKAAEASKKQPAATAGVGLDSDKGGKPAAEAGIDVMRLSQDKFAKLDEETKSRLRGDTV